VRGTRGVVLTTVTASTAVTVATVVMLPQLRSGYRWSAPHVALETAASLVALLAALLIIGRLRRRALLNELMLVAALTVLAPSDLLFGTLPLLAAPEPSELMVRASLVGGMLGALLFALAAFTPCHRLRPPVLAEAGAAISVALVLAIAFVGAYTAGAPQRLAMAGRTVPGSHVVLVLPPPQMVMAVLYGLAVIGYLIRFHQLGDEFMGWLAIAAVLASASTVPYSLGPALSPGSAYLSEAFRLLSYTVLFVAALREKWLNWRGLSETAVVSERRRVARDLHDGLAQELAYLSRNLDLLGEEADAETIGRLRQAAERAQAKSRQAIRALTAVDGQALETALKEATSAIAERFHIELVFDTTPGVRLSQARAEAMVRIACEAVTNAARHSGAGLVHLSLRHEGKRVRLRVSDAGCGFNPGIGEGFGLISVRERADSADGHLRISSAPGRGSEVEVVL
jgi:signal transduction histidine kinase